MPKLRLLLAHGHAPERQRLRALVDAQGDMEVVAEAADARAAAEQARALGPDVIMLDSALPDADTVQTIERIRRECPPTRVLVLATGHDPRHLSAALAAGATGYVLQRVPDQELLAAIRAVHEGRTFVDVDRVSDVALALPAASPAPTDRSLPASHHPLSTQQPLSPRERQVLLLLVRGFANREIARRLRVSVKTIETHRARLARKLGVRTRAELVQYALLAGMLTADRNLSDIA